MVRSCFFKESSQGGWDKLTKSSVLIKAGVEASCLQVKEEEEVYLKIPKIAPFTI